MGNVLMLAGRGKRIRPGWRDAYGRGATRESEWGCGVARRSKRGPEGEGVGLLRWGAREGEMCTERTGGSRGPAEGSGRRARGLCKVFG